MKETNPSKDFLNFTVYPSLEKVVDLAAITPTTKEVVIVTQEVEENEIQLLTKIMQAVNKSVETDTCWLQADGIHSYQAISSQIEFEILLVFGILPKDMGLHLQIRPYQIVQFQGKKMLFVHGLDEVAQNVNYKKQLWGQLQLLFK